jgi:hypothetical protein
MVIFAPAANWRPAVGMAPAWVRDGKHGQVSAAPPSRPVGAGGAAPPVGGGGTLPFGGATPDGRGEGAFPAVPAGGATTDMVLVTITGAPVEVLTLVIVIAAPPLSVVTDVRV